MIQLKTKVNDIFEDSNIIVCVGLEISKIIYHTDDNKLNFLEKIDNINEGEITRIVLCNNQLVCGHITGFLSIWEVSNNPFMIKKSSAKLHQGSINKLLIKKNDNNNTFLITCGDDSKIIILNTNGWQNIYQFDFGNIPITNIIETIDQGKNNSQNKNDNLIVCLQGGNCCCLLMDKNERFFIKSNNGANIRHCCLMENKRNPQPIPEGDILVISDSTKLDVFCWIPEFDKGTYRQLCNNNSNPNNQKPKVNPNHGANKRGRGGFRGGY